MGVVDDNKGCVRDVQQPDARQMSEALASIETGAYSTPTAPSEKLTSAASAADQYPTPEDALFTAVSAANEDHNPQPGNDETDRLMQLVNASLIDPNEGIETTDYLYSWDNVDFMPRQNIVSLKAPAKTGKTFALTAFATAFLKEQFGGMRCYAASSERLLFVDTEQARNSTRKVLHRILKQAPGTESRISVLNVRKCEAKDRLPMIVLSARMFKPSLIIIDGIADLIPGMDYNDQEKADIAITTLCALAEDYNAVVVTAIHTNKGDSKEATGWLGRILLQKCAVEIGLTRKAGDNTRTMEFVVRDREINPITVAIEETEDKLGQIRIVTPAEAAEAEAERSRATYKTRLLELGIEPPKQLSRPEFVKLIVKQRTTDPQRPYNRNNADKFIARCIESGALTIKGEMLCFTYE